MEPWISFFQTTASVVATLTGFIVVAISINHQRIINTPRLPGRAAETLIPLAGALVIAIAALIPNQSRAAYGCEVTVMGLVIGLLCGFSQVRSTKRAHNAKIGRLSGPSLVWIHLIMNHLQSLPFIVAGLLLLLGLTSGFYWIAAAMLLTLVIAVINTWVLLIEILR
ncbi:hypothetical protein [Methylovirgula sp. 4M-Z18]|uniref:hypothetical protein n=1 Tax=Methylovirgula sp. 4M-Z18 TaxID=2293567 RepID=UPI000E2F6D22|nr:hypothetical protein [Methylovirgula sp. 4M-Z18]RFB78799.1 hypothetical protein DYH55_13235 [Methylovirgula sp. 4M-Z18]